MAGGSAVVTLADVFLHDSVYVYINAIHYTTTNFKALANFDNALNLWMDDTCVFSPADKIMHGLP